MTQSGNDPDLRRDFEVLRHRVEGSHAVPDFATMMARVRAEAAGHEVEALRETEFRRSITGRESRRGLWVRWAPLAAAAAFAGLLLVSRPGTSEDAQFERLVAEYATISAAVGQSPTASLMRIPGIDLGAVPSFGTYSSGAPTPERAQERNR